MQNFMLLAPIGGALIASLLNNHDALTIASSFGLCTYLLLIWRLILRGEAYRFYLIAALACGAWTSMAFVQSSFYMNRLSIKSFSSLFGDSSITIDSSDYSLAFAYLYGFIYFSYLISRLSVIRQAEATYDQYVIQRLRIVQPPTWIAMLALASIALGSASFLGLISIRGVAEPFESDEGKLTWWYTAIAFSLSMLPLLISQVVRNIRSWLKPSAFIGIAGIIIALYYSTLESRRSVLGLFTISVFCYLVIQRPMFSFTKEKIFKLATLILIMIIALLFASYLLQFINLIRSDQGAAINPILLANRFAEFLTSPELLQEASEKMSENLASRPLVLWPLAASIKISFINTNQDYIFFQDFWNSLLNSLPRFLVPNKSILLLQENLLFRYFPFASVDLADSPYLYAFASFGVIGMAMYPALIAIAYFIYLRIACEYQQRLSFRTLPGIITLPALCSFATVSYGELATTGLLRMFLVPLLLLGPPLVVSQLLPRRAT